jgi:3-dehydroquinate synthetase
MLWAEIIKHGLIASPDLMQRNFAFFGTLKQTPHPILAPPDQDLLMQALQVKMDLVALDPRESGPRKLLNFGHTMGHALEALIPSLGHGRAVWLGMNYELGLAVSAGLLARDHGLICYENLQLLAPYVSPSSYPSAWPSWKVVLEHLLQDKKNHGGQIRWSLPVDVGQANYDRVVDLFMAEQVYETWTLHPQDCPLIHGQA